MASVTSVSVAEVKQIINTSLTDAEVLAAVSTAQAIINSQLASSGLTGQHLREIIRWLSAHFVAVRDQDEGMVMEQRIGDTAVRYGGRLGEGLKLTRYGQQVLILDTTGTLAAFGRQRAEFKVMDRT